MTTITDEDRAAAAAGYYAWCSGNETIPNRMLAGKADHHSMVQAFARHRQAAEAPLRAEIERLKTDAARYQWLRDRSCPPHNFYISVPDEFSGVRYASHEVDAYIDQARAALGGKQ